MKADEEALIAPGSIVPAALFQGNTYDAAYGLPDGGWLYTDERVLLVAVLGYPDMGPNILAMKRSGQLCWIRRIIGGGHRQTPLKYR